MASGDVECSEQLWIVYTKKKATTRRGDIYKEGNGVGMGQMRSSD